MKHLAALLVIFAALFSGCATTVGLDYSDADENEISTAGEIWLVGSISVEQTDGEHKPSPEVDLINSYVANFKDPIESNVFSIGLYRQFMIRSAKTDLDYTDGRKGHFFAIMVPDANYEIIRLIGYQVVFGGSVNYSSDHDLRIPISTQGHKVAYIGDIIFTQRMVDTLFGGDIAGMKFGIQDNWARDQQAIREKFPRLDQFDIVSVAPEF